MKFGEWDALSYDDLQFILHYVALSIVGGDINVDNFDVHERMLLEMCDEAELLYGFTDTKSTYYKRPHIAQDIIMDALAGRLMDVFMPVKA